MASFKLLDLFTILILVCLNIKCARCGQCNINDEDLDIFNDTGASLRRKGSLSCPGPGDPSHYTECCWDSRFQCCPVHHPIQSIDDQLVMMVGLAVITTCLMLTVGTVVCCFWSRCPLYTACRINYTQGDSIAYGKGDDCMNGIMPPEEKGGVNHYTPNAITIKPVEDV